MKTKNLFNQSGENPDVMSRKGRYSLDPILSRLCLVSLICLCMLTIGSGNVWGYTITFSTGSNTGTKASTSTSCSSIVSEGSTYLTGNLVTATNVYDKTASNLRIGNSSVAGCVKMNLSASGQVEATTIVVNAKQYLSGKKKTLSVNGSAAQTPSDSWGDLTFTINDDITYLQLDASGYLYIKSITVNTGGSGGCSYTEASSLNIGDEILIVYESGATKKQLSTATGTANFVTCASETYKLTVEAGYNGSNLALKNSSGKYLAWSSSTSCSFVDNKTDSERGTKVSWTTTTSDGTLVLKNISSNRYVMYKTSDASVKAYASLSQSGAALFKIYKMPTCTPLGSVNGSISENNATSVTLQWDAVTGAEKYQVKVPGSSSHDNWTDVNSTSVTVTKSCGTAYTAYFRAIDTNGTHCSEGPESTLAIPAVSWTVTSTGITHATASPAIPSTTCSGFSTTISPATGYALPADITVTNASKSWNSSTGALSISSVTGNVSITITPTCVPPVITDDPEDADYYVGDAPTALSVTATLASGTRTYLWKVSTNGGSTWSDATGTNNTFSYSGASLSTASAGTLKFKCIVGNSEGGCSVESGVATITVSNASYFPNGKTLFFEAKTKEESAWKDNAQCKAWFRDCDSGCGEAPWTYWQTDGDSNKKYYAVVIPSTGDYPYVTIQRFSDYTGNTPWGEGGAQTYSTGGGSNVIKSTCASGECLSWSPTSMQIYLRGDITNDEWASNIGEMTDQNGGIWSYTYANYSSSGSTLAFKLYTNYNTWIGNTTDNSNAVLEGMKDGSTYNITATYNIVDHSLVMSKTFVKGTVHFDLQGHGSAISDLTNVTAGSKISAPSAPSATGWDFGGWYKEPACTNEWNFASDVVNETMTLYAKWTAQEYTIAKTLTNVTSSPDIPSTYTYTGSAAGLNYTITPSSGYRLPTTISVSGTTYTWDPATGALALTGTIASDVTISIVAVQTHTVTWLSNGENYVSPVVYDHGATLAFPAGTPSAPSSCSEKVFVGWTSHTEITSETSEAPDLITAGGAVNSDHIYRAVFADASGGGAATYTKVTTISAGTYLMATETADNYISKTTLAYTGDDGTGNYGGVVGVSISTDVISTKPVTAKEITVSIGTGDDAGYFAMYDGSKYITQTAKNKFTFSDDISYEWDLNASGQIHQKGTYNNSSDNRIYMANGNSGAQTEVFKPLTARAEGNNGSGEYNYHAYLFKKTNSISYDNYITQCCSLKPVTSLAVSGKTATSVTLSWTAPSPTTEIDHLELRNASTDAKIGSNIAVGTTTTTVSGLIECETYSYKIVSVGASCETSSEVVDAQPFSGAKTVTYNYHEGSGDPASFTTSCGNITTTLPTPTRTNYRFDGWYTEASGGTRKGGGGDSYTPDATITLHAQWTRVYTVTYAYAGGSGSCAAGGPYAEGETVTTCGSATKAGSTLTGWRRSDNDATVTPGNTFTMPASNVTLTAVWEDTPYTLTQNVGSHTTKGYTTATIKSGDLASSGLDLTYTISDNAYALPKAVTITGGGQTWTLGTNYTWSLSEDKHSATLHIEADLTISADVTVTVTEKARYTVIWDEHGSTTTEYYAADDNTVLEKTGIADCGTKNFVLWTENSSFTEHATTPPAKVTFGTISGDKHYYAIYGTATGTGGYSKVTTVAEGEVYLLACPSQSKVYIGQHLSDGYGDAGDVTITENVISTKGSAHEVRIEGNASKFAIFDIDAEKYIFGPSTNDAGCTWSAGPTVSGTTNHWWNIGSGDYAGEIQGKNQTARYIAYNYNGSNSRFAAYKTPGSNNTGKVYFYKYVAGFKDYSKTCVQYDITIAATSDGTVTTTPAEEAGSGATVTVNVTPNSCKYLSALKYNDGSDHAISIASTPYTFTMPAADVTVTATFADKTVSSIDPVTSTHRTLMQGTSFEGEQIRVTYNNGETEDLAWNASGLTFSGYNMSTLGNQTVSVAYSGSCGSANTSYDIEITDGIPVTFNDCGITTVNKYDPGATVPVKSTLGEYGCSGWVFDGWSETPIVHGSTAGYTIVENFSASVPKTLYAVYVKKENTYTSIDDASELLSGFQYAIMRQYSYNTHMILKAEAGTGVNAGYLVAVNEYDNALSYSSPDYTLTSTEEKYAWQLQGSAGNWALYNKSTNKYLDLSTAGNAEIESAIADRFTITQDAYDDHLFTIRSNTNTTYYLTYNSSYYKSHTSAQKCDILRRSMQFSSTPPCAPRSVTFHGNGGTVIAYEGSPTGGDLTIREATRDAGIKTPTAEYEDCEGKSWSFIGWADHEVDVTRVPVLTTDLLNDGGGNKHHAITTDDEEFWAVYTNQGEALTKYGTISFSMSDFSGNYLSDEHTVTKTVSGDSYVFGDIRVGHASETGIQFEAVNGEFYNKTSLGKINSISFGSFTAGALSNLNVYVGNAEKATTHLLTIAELQVVDGVSTYYPANDCEYVYIKSAGSYACVTSISIEFGKGTKVWATTPDCKRVTLSGDIYATSTNGRGIMAVTPLRVNAFQLDPSAGIVISSNSSDVYFTEDRTPNFAMAAANQPKNSITLTAGSDGNLTTDIYVHYKPSSAGDGVPADVNVYANLAEPDPGVTATHPIHVRNMPEKFVIAAKVGAAWYALPADMSGATNPAGVLIDVDETSMTAIAPNTCSYTLWPVKTVNPASSTYDRYGTNATYDGNAFGERVRFSAINNGNKGLWANNATGVNTINNYAVIAAVGDGGTTENTNPSYEWIITTSVTDGNWQYTLQTDQTQNNRYLRYWSAAAGGPKWGTYASGEQNLYFLPVTEVEPFEMQVVEWYPTKVLVQTEAALASPTVKVNSESVASPVLTNKGGKLWEISGLPLESNPTKSMTVAFTADEKNYACTKTVPIIISREAKTQASEPFATLGATIYTKSDVVVRDGAVLTVNGSNAANTFNDVTIYPTSKISVPSDKKLTVHALTFFGGIDEIYDGSAYAINKYGVPELSLKGTLHKSIAQIDYVMRVDDSQMYSLTVPYEVNLADITYWDGTSMGTLGDKLWVSAYDGAARANKDMSHTWIWEANFASKGLEEKLKAGVGYTISADLQAGVGSTYSILRMPMASNVVNDETELAKTVPVVAYGSESAVSDNHKGWNLVGNPYMVSISGGDADSKLEVGYLQETGTGPWEWVRDTYRYVTIPADNGQDYWQEKFSSATLKPFKNFFVQIGTSGDMAFALTSRQSAPARYLEAQDREVELEILLSNDTRQDNMGLLIADQYSPAYEINADLEKMIGSMSVYTIYGGYNLAYNALSPDDAKQFIPIGYVAPSAGEYTFSLDDDSDVNEIDHIYLTDYQENVTVDLMEKSYSFTTVSGKNESRFALNATLKDEPETPTDIDIINSEGDLNADAPQKFIYHDKMYIYHRGVIYDATGKKVK